MFLKMIIWHLWYYYIKDFECVQFQCKGFHCIAVADKILFVKKKKKKCRMGSLPAWFSLQSVLQCALKDINKHRIDEAYCLLRVRACSACACSASHRGRESERQSCSPSLLEPVTMTTGWLGDTVPARLRAARRLAAQLRNRPRSHFQRQSKTKILLFVRIVKRG